MTGALFIPDDVVLLLFILCMCGGGVFIYTLFTFFVIHSISVTLCVGANIVLQVIGKSAMIFTSYYFYFLFYVGGMGGEFLRLIGQSAKIFTSRQQANNILANADITVCGGLVYEKILTNQILINNFQGKVNSFKCTFLSLCCFLKEVEPESGVKNLPTLTKAL